MSYGIVGFTHSNGYVLCTDCEDGSTVDEGNESGYVFPIFEDAEFDSYPTCDHCNQAIEDVNLTTEGLKWKWLNKHNKKMRKVLDENNGEFPSLTSLGAYPLFYVGRSYGEENALCPTCANKHDSDYTVVTYDINYEDENLYCDDCGEQIHSAYGDDNDTEVK